MTADKKAVFHANLEVLQVTRDHMQVLKTLYDSGNITRQQEVKTNG